MMADKRFLPPLGFFIFISYIIFLADTADYNFAFRVVGHIPYGDKMCHAILYGMMAFLLNYGLGFRRCCAQGKCPWGMPQHLQFLYRIKAFSSSRFKGALVNAPYIGSIIVLTFAILEEFSQYYIPSRTFDLGDLLADFIGIVLISSYWKA